MGKIWFCRNCGYEAVARGKCHACGEILTKSPLLELEAGDEATEVGYKVSSWSDWERARLIEALIDSEILHRFENDELVVRDSDEEKVDDLLKNLTAIPEGDKDQESGSSTHAPLVALMQQLLFAVRRLVDDPTDMDADVLVTELAPHVYSVEVFPGSDLETWAAIGRTTRRLLAALGADEALEEQIWLQASILSRLLGYVLDIREGSPDLLVEEELIDDEEFLDDLEFQDQDDDDEDDEDDDEDLDDEEDDDEEDEADDEELLYELPEWLPEHRVNLSILLDKSGIEHIWEEGNLIIESADEEQVDELFLQVEGVDDGVGDVERYAKAEELFATTDRYLNDPDSKDRKQEIMDYVDITEGPAPVGVEEALWWQLRAHSRALAEAIDEDQPQEVVFSQAASVRELLARML